MTLSFSYNLKYNSKCNSYYLCKNIYKFKLPICEFSKDIFEDIFEEKKIICEKYKKILTELYEEYIELNDLFCGEINETKDIEKIENEMNNIKLRIKKIKREYFLHCKDVK
jgi:hypothetical protein